MLPNFQNPTGDLLWIEKGSVQYGFPDAITWGKKWQHLLTKQEGITNAWVGLVDGNRSIHWVENPSPDPMPAQFSDDVSQGVILSQKVYTFTDHIELISGGLFPLIQNGRVLGLIGLMSGQTDYFKADAIKWIRTLTGIISDSLVREDGGVRQREAEYTITRILQTSLELRDVLPSVLDILAEVLEADAMTALHYIPMPRRFELLITHGLEVAALAKLNFHFDVGMVGRSFPSELLWIEDLRDLPPNLQPISQLDEEEFRGYLALPLVARNDLIGVLEVAWKSPKRTATWDAGFLNRVAGQIAFAMERTYILGDLRKNNAELMARYNAMIEGLSRALELRDLETDGHTRRVSVLTMRLVDHMHIPIDQWDSIRQGALLHDIGKIGIPDAILLKPGSLTAREKEVMRQHVVYGYNILVPIINVQHTLDITLYHHEYWDGKGYPYGLRGEQIPLVARLFAVVDVFDALSSDRPYRQAWSRLQVLEYLKKQAGRQFDPQIVKYFLEIAEESALK
jgi:HD-GYP domain-containing protein (c-di-GMP phosphodiesterase class II)